MKYTAGSQKIKGFWCVVVLFFFEKKVCGIEQNPYICIAKQENNVLIKYARIAQLVEHNLAKVGVASSS
ncbi:MAG: hypothetical protein ACEPOZ_11540, partial [Marinifilaceae bacterium]